jgi:hypothetical protein
MSGAQRSPEDIRRSIEANRVELGEALSRLKTEVAVATDWRAKLRANRKQALVAAGVAGFVLGGGIGGLVGLVFGSKPD